MLQLPQRIGDGGVGVCFLTAFADSLKIRLSWAGVGDAAGSHESSAVGFCGGLELSCVLVGVRCMELKIILKDVVHGKSEKLHAHLI